MTKCCPIMSKREQTYGQVDCVESNCAFWDEEMKMCCIKSAMIAVADKKNGGSNPSAQAYYIPPSSYYYTDASSNIHLETDLISNPVYNGGL